MNHEKDGTTSGVVLLILFIYLTYFEGQSMNINPRFFIFPAILAAIALIFASLQLLPLAWGLSVASVLALVLMTSASLLHPHIDGELLVHIFVYGVVLLLSFGFALQAIPMELGPRLPVEAASMNWLQVGFVVMQQMCYFGVHGFSLKSERH